MRHVYQGNVSIPLHVIKAFLGMNDDPSINQQAEATANLLTELRNAVKNIEEGLDKANLTVCVGKSVYVNPFDLQRFLSNEIPRMCVYRKAKDNHDMPLYHKLPPQHYIKRAKKRAAMAKTNKKGKGHATS